VRLNLIVEGPDGAGKTTLIHQLREAYPQLPEPTRAATSTGGPISNMAKWIERDTVGHLIRSDFKLYDRHPLISGPIYEPWVPQSFSTSGMWYQNRLDQLLSCSYVVICLPVFDTVRENITHEPQLMGVNQHIDELWNKYWKLVDMGGFANFWYDYEEPNDLYDLCIQIEENVL
jgi:GTPase SAR1 family protein